MYFLSKKLLWLLCSLFLIGIAFWFVGKPSEQLSQPIAQLGVGQPLFNEQAVQVYEVCNLNSARRTSLETDLKTLKARNPNLSLRALNGKEKAELKGCEIAKIGSIPKTQQGDYFIEVLSLEPRIGGITTLVRVWDKNNQPIGFGDGTVDIERMNFINPPVLINDVNGSIIRTWIEDGQTKTRKLTEDPKKALLISIEHALNVKPRFVSDKIITGKIGNTTTSMRPAAGSVSPVDGYVMIQAQASFALAHDATDGDEISDATASTNKVGLTRNDAGNFAISRAPVWFSDGGAIGTDEVSSSTLSMYGNGTAVLNNDSSSVVLVENYLAASSTIALADYNDFTTTAYATTALSAWLTTDGTQNIFTLDQIGWDKIEFDSVNNGGIIRFAFRNSLDTTNTAPASTNQAQTYFADNTGTVSDPLLVVDHAAVIVPTQDHIPPILWFEALKDNFTVYAKE